MVNSFPDDETGDLVYSYPREIEDMRHRRKLEVEVAGESVPSRGTVDLGDDTKSGPSTPRDEARRNQQIVEAKGGGGPGLDGTLRRGRRLGNTENQNARTINRDISSNARMPALVGGVLVLAHTKSSEDIISGVNEAPGVTDDLTPAENGMGSARRVVGKIGSDKDSRDKVCAL